MIGNATAAELPASSDDQQQWVADARCGAIPKPNGTEAMSTTRIASAPWGLPT